MRLIHCFVLFAAGCGSETAPGESDSDSAPTPIAGSAFAPARAGAVAGRVKWAGPIPSPAPFLHGLPRRDGTGFEFKSFANPNTPEIDPNSRAVAGAVVFLRGVDVAAARAWDLPPVSVELADGSITVVQGNRRGRTGFVRRGDRIYATSADAAYHVLRGRGSDFFSLTLPDPGKPASRKLDAPGLVELSSGTGQYWAQARLFVTDHPYYTVTDGDGRFVIDRVPAGAIEAVVWLPGWDVVKQERDPDSTTIARQTYAPAIERAARVTISAERRAELDVTVSK